MDTTRLFDLAPGRPAALDLRRGDLLVVVHGLVVADGPPRWLAETVVPRREAWTAGTGLSADAAGRWDCLSPEGARIAVVRRAPWWRRLRALLSPAARRAARRTPASACAAHRGAPSAARARATP